MVQRLFADVINDAIWFMNIHEQNHPWFLAMVLLMEETGVPRERYIFSLCVYLRMRPISFHISVLLMEETGVPRERYIFSLCVYLRMRPISFHISVLFSEIIAYTNKICKHVTRMVLKHNLWCSFHSEIHNDNAFFQDDRDKFNIGPTLCVENIGKYILI